MCLNSISQRIEKPTEKPQWGWKHFEKVLAHSVVFSYAGTIGKRGVWLRAKANAGTKCFRHKYPEGFHFYLSREDAENEGGMYGERSVRIRVRRVHTTGFQHDKMVGVAYELFVPKPRRRKKCASPK